MYDLNCNELSAALGRPGEEGRGVLFLTAQIQSEWASKYRGSSSPRIRARVSPTLRPPIGIQARHDNCRNHAMAQVTTITIPEVPTGELIFAFVRVRSGNPRSHAFDRF